MTYDEAIERLVPVEAREMLRVLSDDQLIELSARVLIKEDAGRIDHSLGATTQIYVGFERLRRAIEMEGLEDGERAEPTPTV